jgi:hypothetical protein
MSARPAALRGQLFQAREQAEKIGRLLVERQPDQIDDGDDQSSKPARGKGRADPATRVRYNRTIAIARLE